MNDLAQALQNALQLISQGHIAAAGSLLQEILRQQPQQPDARHLLGVTLLQQGDYPGAVDALGEACRLAPQQADFWLNLSIAYQQLGQLTEAADSLSQAVSLRPQDAEARFNLATLQVQLGRRDLAMPALAVLSEALPQASAVHYLYASLLLDAGDAAAALSGFEKTLALAPQYAEAHVQRGNALFALARYEEAAEAFAAALALRPDYANALINRGNALRQLLRYEEALIAYDAALVLPLELATQAAALTNRAAVLRELQRHEAAVACYQTLLELAPETPYARGLLFDSRLHCVDWTDYESEVAALEAAVLAGSDAQPAQAAIPFSLLAYSGKAEVHRRCARDYTAWHYPPSPQPLWQGERYTHERIRVAYLSGDFHSHATAYLMAELFERHDRSRFDLLAVSIGPQVAATDDPMRARLLAAFPEFIVANGMSDRAVAEQLRQREVDIVVDLKGYTQGCRPGILAQRPVPLQINYLGYPGTLGASWVDYLLADQRVLPPELAAQCDEAVVWLPDSYQVNDSRRLIAAIPSREEAGLPPQGFVFCCFNNNFKISPAVFAVWMRLLAGRPGSVLWLLADNAAAERNLRAAATAHGVDPARLIFAPRRPLAEHLARQRLADLFLDTVPYNAHTTASDALWAGLPVLTTLGTAFPGRVAASLLSAVGLPELIAEDLAEYERLAALLAREPAQLTELRARLQAGLAAHNLPLFDCARFTGHLETAYRHLWQRAQQGLPPQGFAVADVGHG